MPANGKSSSRIMKTAQATEKAPAIAQTSYQAAYSEIPTMIIAAVALILFIVLVGVTLLGGRLRRLLPAHHRAGRDD